MPDAYQELTTCYSQEDMACKKKVLQGEQIKEVFCC